MPDKKSFLHSINTDTVFDIEFFKKVCGYSVCDNLFLGTVADKLISIGRKNVVQAYNEWFTTWKAEHIKEMKKVASWYRNEFDKQFESWMKTERERMVKEWKQRELELLQRKKILLLTKKSMQLTES